MSRNYVFAPDEYYHVYARGMEKMDVYNSKSDYKRFVETLYLLNSKKPQVIRDIYGTLKHRGLTSVFDFDKGETLVDIGAYCLMPNHFHILLKEKDPDGKGVSKFMQKLMTSYTMYFNQKNERAGRLFSSAFKARHVTDDNHLKYLFAYIHMNPRDIVGDDEIDAYEYSSYPEYLGRQRLQKAILTPDSFPNYFSGSLNQEIGEWLLYDYYPEV